jgi:aryl-alcohol dehydrogenase-like predicted oxidoreductase
LTENLRDIAAGIDQSLARLAIAWVLAHPAVTSAIVGARRPGQIEVSASAGDIELSEEVMAQIDALLADRDDELIAAGAVGDDSLR